MNDVIDDWMIRAAENKAATLLLLPGSPPVYRAAGRLQVPLQQEVLTFHDTQRVAERLLSDQATQQLNQNGSTEFPFAIAGVRGVVTIFYGQGSHHLVFHIEQDKNGLVIGMN